ncbi:cytochrome P450 [Mycena floridula]|nr:cytochrome P450 [Mycena floridula]
MSVVAHLSAFNLLGLGILTWILFKLVQRLVHSSYATPLPGPTSSPSLLYGYLLKLVESPIATAIHYQNWATEYGPVYSIPWIFGSRRTILMDPKAIAHFYARGEAGYTQTDATRNAISRLFGNGILTAEGEVHRRQRKSLNPSFSPATIRGITSVFFDAGYKLKAVWDSQLDASTEDFTTVEVHKWYEIRFLKATSSHTILLDSIGLGGFSHDFGTLDGKQPLIATALDSFGKSAGNHPQVTPLSAIMGKILPILLKLPIGRAKLIIKLKESLTSVGNDLVERVRKEQNMEGRESSDKSVIGALIKSSNSDADMYLSQEEIQGQNTLLIAGQYTFKSISYCYWALIELARSKDKQEKLRQELLTLGPNDATYDQLASATALPYLDAVVHEILRLHAAVPETARQCNADDIVPLSTPITTRNGQVVSEITIPKGALVVVPIGAVNTSEAFWGPDAKDFRPERWLEPESGLAKEIQSHRHILTFISGPRECLGKTFALTEFKAVLSLMIRNYTFELSGGPETKIGEWRGLLVRPNAEGQVEGRVPMIIRRVN